MSVKNGIELCKTLKKDVRTSHIPIILLTAKDTLEDKEEGYEVGADSYLYTISEISFRVGINTISYFRQCFQKGYEMSPSQYLKKIKGVNVKEDEELEKDDFL